jgi:hypothetical protein
VPLSWSVLWSCTTCTIEEDVYLSTDPQLEDESYAARSFCPASSAPDCPTTLTVGPLAPGAYYWAVEIWADADHHYSTISRFTIGPNSPVPPAVAPPTPTGGFVFTDSSTDGRGAANITAVTVSNDPATGDVSMRVFAPSLQRPQPGEAFFVYFDTDENPDTGDPGSLGTEFRIRLSGDTNTFTPGRWNGAGYSSSQSSTISVRYEANDFLITMKARDLKPSGTLTGFNFWTGTYRTTGPFLFFDWAPDYDAWNYRLTAPQTPPKPATLTAMKVATLPSAPTAGLPFRVLVTRVTLSTGLSQAPQHVACSATVGGAALRGKGAGGCTFAVPAKAAGKTMAVRVTATYGDAKRVETLRFKVRRG